jgi:radical SAM-linked protein
MVADKVRIRFRKDGDLRFVSHHDLMRSFERMLRRAGLPFHSTNGFNPKPRLVFALSLPLGIVGCAELAELELDSLVAPQEIHERLASQAPAGLSILGVERVHPKTTAHVRLVRYRVRLAPAQSAGLTQRIEQLLNRPDCWVERTRPEKRRIDLRPYLSVIRETAASLEMELRVTPQGTARPEEVLRLLELERLIEDGVVVERTAVIVEEDVHKTSSPSAAAETDLKIEKESHEERNAH